MLTILASLIGAYVILIGILFLVQHRLLFFPTSVLVVTPSEYNLAAEELWIITEDNEQLHSWYFPNKMSDQIIVLSHGNAGNISHRLDIAQTLLETGAAVLMYDYRGYGKSTGKPSESGLYLDIEAVINALINEKGYQKDHIYLYGRSLGGAVSAYAATKFAVGGLVLDSAFKNVRAMIRDVYPFVPAFLARYEFPTQQFLNERKDMPVMIMHSNEDEIVRFHHGKTLFEMTKEPKKFVLLNGGHNTNFHVSRDLIRNNWIRFLEPNESTITFE